MFETPSQRIAFAVIAAMALVILANLGFIFYEAIYGRVDSGSDQSSLDGLPKDAESGESDHT